MKKHLLLVICVCLIICLIISLTPVSLAKDYDSLHMSENEVSMLHLPDDYVVVKLYSGSYMSKFAAQESIETILQRTTPLYMVISSDAEITYYVIREGESSKITTGKISDWSQFYKYALSPEKIFGKRKKVYNVYCLEGEHSYNGVYILFETSKGTYVLYKQFLLADEMYIFPIDEFYQYAAMVQAEREAHTSEEASKDLLAKYEWNEFGAQKKVTSVFLLVLGGASLVILCFWFNKKKKAKEKVNPEVSTPETNP